MANNRNDSEERICLFAVKSEQPQTAANLLSLPYKEGIAGLNPASPQSASRKLIAPCNKTGLGAIVAGWMNVTFSEGLRNKVAEAKEPGMPARKIDRAFGGDISSLKRNAKTIYKAEGRLLRSRAPRRTPHRGVEQGEKASR
jgi:hypothetical protein